MGKFFRFVGEFPIKWSVYLLVRHKPQFELKKKKRIISFSFYAYLEWVIRQAKEGRRREKEENERDNDNRTVQYDQYSDSDVGQSDSGSSLSRSASSNDNDCDNKNENK